jgi:hypothetical protein
LTDGNVDAIEPLGLEFDGHQKVVKVHDGMDSKVHGDKKEPSRGLGHICMPAIQQDRNVVIPVQENERFLVNDNKESVKEFAVMVIMVAECQKKRIIDQALQTVTVTVPVA